MFFLEVVVCGQLGCFDMEAMYLYELYILVFALMVLAWYRHKDLSLIHILYVCAGGFHT